MTQKQVEITEEVREYTNEHGVTERMVVYYLENGLVQWTREFKTERDYGLGVWEMLRMLLRSYKGVKALVDDQNLAFDDYLFIARTHEEGKKRRFNLMEKRERESRLVGTESSKVFTIGELGQFASIPSTGPLIPS